MENPLSAWLSFAAKVNFSGTEADRECGVALDKPGRVFAVLVRWAEIGSKIFDSGSSNRNRLGDPF